MQLVQNFQAMRVKNRPLQYQLVETEEDALKIYEKFSSSKILVLETKTTSTNAIDAKLVGLNFAIEEGKVVQVAILTNVKKRKEL